MRLEEYDSESEAIRMCDELEFQCENDHSVTVYSSDPYYPDWVRCPDCGELMEQVVGE